MAIVTRRGKVTRRPRNYTQPGACVVKLPDDVRAALVKRMKEGEAVADTLRRILRKK